MATILNNAIEKVMPLFYKNKKEKFHLREIARQTGLYGQSITRYLNKLEKEHILKSEKDGNLKKYNIKHNKHTFLIFTAFDVKKIESLPSIKKNAIKHYLNNLQEKPIFTIIFGSTAKGTYKKNSDIDILLVTNNIINTKKAEREADTQCATKISTFQITYNNFKRELKLKEDHVIQSAIQTGYPITNHIEYYEMIFNE